MYLIRTDGMLMLLLLFFHSLLFLRTELIGVSMPLTLKEITGNEGQTNITVADILNDKTHNETVTHPQPHSIKRINTRSK